MGRSLAKITIGSLLALAALMWPALYNGQPFFSGNWRGLAVIGGCMVLAYAAEAAFGIVVTHLVDAPPLRPPFLMARVIEDGTGYRYLRKTCPANGFKVCEFLPRLPMPADVFIWAWNPPGVFAPATPEMRRELSAEQHQFVRAVLMHDPWGVASASAQNTLRQFTQMGLAEFNYSDKGHFAAKLPVEDRAAFRDSAAYQGSMPTRSASLVQLMGFGVGAVTLLAMLVWPQFRRRLDGQQKRIVVFIAVGVAANAAICGVLSGPHDRYEARVAWLIPFVALTAGLALLERRPYFNRPWRPALLDQIPLTWMRTLHAGSNWRIRAG